MNRVVRAATLTSLLGVDRATIYRWTVGGLLARIPGMGDPHYYERDIDRMLATVPRTTQKVLTYDDLRVGREVLVRRSIAGRQLNLTEANMDTQLRQGRLHGLQLGHYWYVTQSSINYYLRVTQYTPEMVCHIIGLPYARSSRKQFADLLRSGKLKRHGYSGRSGIYVTAESLDEYLSSHLPSWLTPELWREERLGDLRPLLTLEHIATYLHRRPIGLPAVLERERLAAIWLPGRYIRRYSPTGFDTYMELERVPSREEIGYWFGVHPTAINIWRARALIHCPLSQHNHPPLAPLYESCWSAIIKPLLSPGIQHNSWILERRQQRGGLMGRQLASVRMGITPDQVIELAERGELKGIRTPMGEWRFTTHAVKVAKSGLKHAA